MEQCRVLAIRVARLPETGVYASSSHAGEPEVEAVGDRAVEASRLPQRLRVQRVSLGDRSVPVRLEVAWPWVAAAVRAQLVQRHLENSHAPAPPYRAIDSSARLRRPWRIMPGRGGQNALGLPWRIAMVLLPETPPRLAAGAMNEFGECT
jgi:hypothetical protein